MHTFSGLYFPEFTEYSVQMEENKDQKISQYGYFSRSKRYT